MNKFIFQPNFGGTEAPLFVIDHTWVPPPTEAQFLQDEQQLFLWTVFFQFGIKTLLFL
jgi:hypothetical protein